MLRGLIVSAWSKNQLRPGQRHVAVHALEGVQRAADRLVIGGVQAEGPAVLGKDAHHLLELAFHGGGKLGAGFAEILEVGGGEDEHLARAVVAVEVAALAGRDHAGPSAEIGSLAALVLSEEVVGDAERQRVLPRQLLDDGVVVGVVLEAAAGIDRGGDAEAVQLPHEVARRELLQVGRQLRAGGERRIEDQCVGLGQQQAGRLAGGVALDQPARRVGRVLGVAHRPQRGTVQQRAVVEVQDEDRRLGRGRVDLGQRRQALLRPLVLDEAADHPHPLRRRRAGGLRLEHRHRVGQRRHAVPAQLHQVVQPAADDVDVAVDQPGDGAAAAGVDDLRGGAGQRHDVPLLAHREEAAILHGQRRGLRQAAVEGRDACVAEDEVGGRAHARRSASGAGARGASARKVLAWHIQPSTE
jgi:hypothetical protein